MTETPALSLSGIELLESMFVLGEGSFWYKVGQTMGTALHALTKLVPFRKDG